ncbi:MAG: thioredoxin [Prevotellaceae bacterium]|jgi:thioredoxin|nr:thioredoxin [Prevotellaceae bacterium]
MKKVFLLMVFLGIVCSCGRAANQSNKSKSVKPATKTITLSKDEFLKRVVDYEADFLEWKYLGDKPAIVDFYADWCAPCKMIAPLLEELADEYEGRIYIYKVNTEKEKDVAAAFGIQTIPLLLFIPMGADPQVVKGALPKAKLKEVIESILIQSE